MNILDRAILVLQEYEPAVTVVQGVSHTFTATFKGDDLRGKPRLACNNRDLTHVGWDTIYGGHKKKPVPRMIVNNTAASVANIRAIPAIVILPTIST